MKIGDVSLNVSDLARSLEFYQSILGFKTIGKSSKERALLSVNGRNVSHLLELVQVQADQVSPNPHVGAKRAGLYHFAILLPERKFLADMLRNLREKRHKVHFDGLTDHLVSESIYIRDPDFNGIEIYRDRPASEWRWDGSEIEMSTIPLDTDDLSKESTEKGWKEMPVGTTLGHVHLHVRNIAAAKKFYNEILGLNLTAEFPGAAFFAASNYHHHIAGNTWLGTGIAPASPNYLGLNHFSIELSTKVELTALKKQLALNNVGIIDESERSLFVQDMDGISVLIRHR